MFRTDRTSLMVGSVTLNPKLLITVIALLRVLVTLAIGSIYHAVTIKKVTANVGLDVKLFSLI